MYLFQLLGFGLFLGFGICNLAPVPVCLEFECEAYRMTLQNLYSKYILQRYVDP